MLIAVQKKTQREVKIKGSAIADPALETLKYRTVIFCFVG